MPKKDGMNDAQFNVVEKQTKKWDLATDKEDE
jgi:hypothetical protein